MVLFRSSDLCVSKAVKSLYTEWIWHEVKVICLIKKESVFM